MQKAVRFFFRFGLASLKGGLILTPNQKGGDTMAVYEAINLMLTFGLLIVSLLGLVIVIVKHLKK